MRRMRHEAQKPNIDFFSSAGILKHKMCIILRQSCCLFSWWILCNFLADVYWGNYCKNSLKIVKRAFISSWIISFDHWTTFQFICHTTTTNTKHHLRRRLLHQERERKRIQSNVHLWTLNFPHTNGKHNKIVVKESFHFVLLCDCEWVPECFPMCTRLCARRSQDCEILFHCWEMCCCVHWLKLICYCETISYKSKSLLKLYGYSSNQKQFKLTISKLFAPFWQSVCECADEQWAHRKMRNKLDMLCVYH